MQERVALKYVPYVIRTIFFVRRTSKVSLVVVVLRAESSAYSEQKISFVLRTVRILTRLALALKYAFSHLIQYISF